VRSEPELVTYRDIVDILAHSVGGLGDHRQHARVLEAVGIAIRDVVGERDWHYYLEHGRVTINAPQEGTIDGTTGVTVRTPTKALPYGASVDLDQAGSDTWPSWAAQGRIRFGDSDIEYIVGERTTDYRIYTTDGHSPTTADAISLGDTYNIYQTVYPLPGDLVKIVGSMHDENNWWSSCYVSPDEWLARSRHVAAEESGPFRWTIGGDPNYLGNLAMLIEGWPDAEKSLDFMYSRRERPMRHSGTSGREGEKDGVTATGTSGSTTVTMTGLDASTGTNMTNFVGSIFRIYDTTARPSGRYGRTPYMEQHVIAAGGTSSITLATQLVNSYDSGVGYIISDPVDMPQYLINLLIARAKLELLEGTDREVKATRKYQEELLKAQERDAVVTLPTGADTLNLWSWLTPPELDRIRGGTTYAI
jgi:hypothetical protein